MDIYSECESLLKDINSVLEKNLSQSDLSILNKLNNKWMQEKSRIQQLWFSADSYGIIERNQMLIEEINKHCYKVINTLMN